MKKLALVFALVLTSLSAFADEITFSFIASSGKTSLIADTGGVVLGPSLNVLVSDATTGASFPLVGVFTSNTGAASTFTVSPTIVVATYNGSGPNSVLIKDSMGNALVSGITEDRAAFISGFPNGAGAFLSKFEVTDVAPSVLALFGLGPSFSPEGSVSVTAARGNLVGGTLEATIGGGTVTITTPFAAVPESSTSSLGVIGLGLVLTSLRLRSQAKG
jgi:hypothetical protein